MSNIDDLPAYDEEEIQLMDSDSNNLQLEEQIEGTKEENNSSKVTIRNPITFDDTEDDQIEQNREKYRKRFDSKRQKPQEKLLIFDKVKLYLRDGPNAHHVETQSIIEKFYDLASVEKLNEVSLTDEEMKNIWKSLNLNEESFRTNPSSSGIYRPESLYLRGVKNMSTQKIFDLFEEFEPVGIEWVSDDSCNMFWNETVSPLRVLNKASTNQQQNIFNEEQKKTNKRKFDDISKSNNQSSDVSHLLLEPWRKMEFLSDDETKQSITLYVRYSTTKDRKVIGSQKYSEYYREYGNPNFDNMTGFISRSKKRELTRSKGNNFWNFTVVKSNDDNLSTTTIDNTPAEETTNETDVKFTVVLPTKKSDQNPNSQDEETDERPTKKQRRHHSSEESSEKDEDEHKQSRNTHFTVTIDPKSNVTKEIVGKLSQSSSPSNRQRSSFNERNDESSSQKSSVLDARQILQRKRRNRV